MLGYHFNTSETGAGGGLWLRMNVEHTYEYMYGPESSAGFKVTTHCHVKILFGKI